MKPASSEKSNYDNYLFSVTVAVKQNEALFFFLLLSVRPPQSSGEDPEQCDFPVRQPLLHRRERHRHRFHHFHPQVYRIPVWDPSFQRQHLHR